MRAPPRRGRRYVRRPPDLTSLFDVMFIVVFVALIRAAAAQQALAELTPPPPPPPEPAPPAPPAPPPGLVALRAQALANLDRELAGRAPLIVRLSAAPEQDRVRARIAALELGAQQLPLDVPLLSDNRDPEAEADYLGDRSAELRVCRLAAVHLRLPDLSKHLVIIVPDRPVAELKRFSGSRALFRGLEQDLVRCSTEQRGMATLVDPAELTPP